MCPRFLERLIVALGAEWKSMGKIVTRLACIICMCSTRNSFAGGMTICLVRLIGNGNGFRLQVS